MVVIAITKKIIYNVCGDFMNIDLTRLNNDIDKEVNIDTHYSFSKEEMEGTDLIECNCDIKGVITKNSLKDIILDLSVKGVMVIPCAITLKPTEYPYNIQIKGTLSEILNKNEEIFTNTLDIFPIIWENILMEIPMRVVSPDAEDIKLEGEGWRLVTDEDITSSPLIELEDLIKDREVK